MTFQILDDKGKPLSHGQQMASLVAMDRPLNLRSIYDTLKGSPHARLSLVEGARAITYALAHKLVQWENVDKQTMYSPTPEAIQFWKDHANKTPDEIWVLWVQAHPDSAESIIRSIPTYRAFR